MFENLGKGIIPSALGIPSAVISNLMTLGTLTFDSIRRTIHLMLPNGQVLIFALGLPEKSIRYTASGFADYGIWVRKVLGEKLGGVVASLAAIGLILM